MHVTQDVPWVGGLQSGFIAKIVPPRLGEGGLDI